MTTITFDTLAYVKTLREAGVEEKQAEAQATALAAVLKAGVTDLATQAGYGAVSRGTQKGHGECVGNQGRVDPLGGRRRCPANHADRGHPRPPGESDLTNPAPGIAALPKPKIENGRSTG